MPHSAKLYRVHIHPKRKPDQRLTFGNLGSQAPSAAFLFKRALSSLNVHDKTARSHLRFEMLLPGLQQHEIGAVVLRGGAGVESVIRQQGTGNVVRNLDDVEEVRAAVMCRLADYEAEGTMVVHIPHDLGYISLLTQAIKKEIRRHSLVAVFEPVVRLPELVRAAQNGLVRRVRLIADRRGNALLQDAHVTGMGQGLRRIVVSFEAKRMSNLETSRLTSYLRSPSAAGLRDLTTFQGIAYDGIDVEVRLPGGNTRTFNVTDMHSGQATSIDLAEVNLGHPAASAADSASRTLGRGGAQLVARLRDVMQSAVADQPPSADT